MERGTQRFWRRRSTRIVLLIAVLMTTANIAFGAYRYWRNPATYTGASRLKVDLSRPEMLLATRNLARLPKDVADAPALAGLVDKALVFHYQEDEARLSLEGMLRRLAYEHDLDIQDRFLATLLAAPAEIAFWRGAKGRPEHFAAVLERGALGKLAGVLAKIALDDRQIEKVGTFSVGGEEVTLYALAYGAGRTLAFAALRERWVFLSDPGLALDAPGQPSAAALALLGELLHGRHPWQETLPQAQGMQHSLVMGSRMLTLNYDHFLPALSGLRLDHDGKAWHASLRLDANALPPEYDPAAVWRAVPLGAALCVALPVQWQTVAAPLGHLLGEDPELAPTLAALDPIGAVCWYAGSRFSTPLFVARAARTLPPNTPALLARLAGKAWRVAPEASANRDVLSANMSALLARLAGKVWRGAPEASVNQDGHTLLSANMPSVHGLRLVKGAGSVFSMALAQHGDWLFFSPDRRRVEAALAVAAKRAPALGDEAGLQGSAWLMVDPAQLAALVQSEIQAVLPADEESYFREIARSRLWPRLKTWGEKQRATVAVPGRPGGEGFIALEFKPLKGSAP